MPILKSQFLDSPIFKVHNHAFIKLLAFRIQLVLAYQIIAVTVGWHIYEITHDPLALGLIGLAEVIPYFVCALFAGHAIDHYCSRRFFGALAGCLLSINALTLTIVSLGLFGHNLSANTSVWIYASMLLQALHVLLLRPATAHYLPLYCRVTSLPAPQV